MCSSEFRSAGVPPAVLHRAEANKLRLCSWDRV